MLVLTRKASEKIIVGDGIEIMVVAIHGGKVKLGITAPRAMAVDREEIREAKRSDDEDAAYLEWWNKNGGAK